MAAPTIRYDLLVQQALRGMVRDLLTDAAKSGLPGDHHFFVTFDSTAEGVRMSERLKEQYPEEMTVVLQYQFRDLKVTERGFEVVLSFGGVPERLVVPFAAVKGFADPSVQFALQFEALELSSGDDDEDAEDTPDTADQPPNKPASPPSARPAAAPAARTAKPAGETATPADTAPAAPADGKSGAEVVRLDRFRKK